MKKADLLDRKILKVISVDARRSFKEIAAHCGVSRAAIHQRVVRMFERGIITGSGYQVNPKYLGFGTCSFIGIKLERGNMYNSVVQELNKIPARFTLNPERQKPYGTAHAILVAKDAVKEPFAVINADDFYGKEAFSVMANFLLNEPATVPPTYAMVGYRLDKTLSKNGTVSRGVCSTNSEGYLTTIVENRKLGYTDKGIENIEEDLYGLYQGDEPVSMNFWGFTPDFFDCLNDLFVDFLNKNQDNIKAEYPIPDVISYLMNNNKAQIKVLKCDAEWFGVTYKEDRPDVVERLKHVE